jgi:hypothetical protein
LKCATYGDRLKKLNVDSLELRRLRLDLLLTYKILYNKVDVDRDNLFTVRNGLVTRGHSFKLFMPRSTTTVRHKFYCIRIVTVWNDLPATGIEFQSFANFKTFLYKLDLSKHIDRNYD